eukprot:jgi/Bigna1/60124/fgenesh1_kg.9_\
MTPTKVSQSGYAPLDNDEERKDRSYRTDVKNSASPQMSSGRKRGRSRENKGFKISFVDESFFVVARPWKSLAFQQSKDTIGRYLYWGLPLYVLCSTVFVGYSQFATTGTSQLDIEDNNRDVLNSNVKDYSNIDNVRMTFDSGATHGKFVSRPWALRNVSIMQDGLGRDRKRRNRRHSVHDQRGGQCAGNRGESQLDALPDANKT